MCPFEQGQTIVAISNHEDHGADNDSRNHANPLIKKIMVQTRSTQSWQSLNQENHGADNDSRNHGNPLIMKMMVQTTIQAIMPIL